MVMHLSTTENENSTAELELETTLLRTHVHHLHSVLPCALVITLCVFCCAHVFICLHMCVYYWLGSASGGDHVFFFSISCDLMIMCFFAE